MKTLSGAALALLLTAGLAHAGLDDVDNQADINHPNIHDNVGDGSNANPRGANNKGDNLHGIANNPGQSGASPRDGARGFADQLQTVHGGIGDVNKNAD